MTVFLGGRGLVLEVCRALDVEAIVAAGKVTDVVPATVVLHSLIGVWEHLDLPAFQGDEQVDAETAVRHGRQPDVFWEDLAQYHRRPLRLDNSDCFGGECCQM